MKIILHVVIIILLACATGCRFQSPHLNNLWFYTYNSNAGNNESPLTPANFLELRHDGSFTLDFGKFEYGSWSFSNNQLYLTNQNHETRSFPLNYPGGKEMQLTINKDLIANFESQPIKETAFAKDPFSKMNNNWRIPAIRKETDDEIRKRLLNHCQFWEVYFTWALDNEIATIDVRSTPTLIKIYGNGFTLKPIADLPLEWKSYFYDTEDCERANKYIDGIFEKKNIAWAHTDNKYKMFISAFQQMEHYLK